MKLIVIYVESSFHVIPYHGIIHSRFLPWIFFVPPFKHVPPTSFEEETVSPNPILTSYKLWKSICLRIDLLLAKLKQFWGLVIFPAGQKLEIMTFRYLKNFFDKFFIKLKYYLMFLFLNYWTVSPIHFRKIDMTTKSNWGVIKFPHLPPDMKVV